MNGDPVPKEPPADIAIAPATADDRLGVLRVLDAAMLETDAEVVDAAIDAGDALVARFKRTDAVVGALVATRPGSGRLHVDAVAVRRARRGRGIGSALVAAAVRRGETDPEVDVVTAEFTLELEGFYTDLGFALDSDTDEGDIDEIETDRLRGRYPLRGGGVDAEGTGERRR